MSLSYDDKIDDLTELYVMACLLALIAAIIVFRLFYHHIIISGVLLSVSTSTFAIF